MGEQTLKNIERPVRVYRVALDRRRPRGSLPRRVAAAADKAKPSIAVLPFTNMSGDPEQEYFADGITEDIITDLSKVSALSVIARNSVFTYKGKPADVQEVGRRFNVANVLEGSVRKAGQRVRINAQLIDAQRRHASLGRPLRPRPDRHLRHPGRDHQDDRRAAQGQAAAAGEEGDRGGADAERRGLQLLSPGPAPLSPAHEQHVLLAQRMFRKAVELDPTYARAYAGLADCAWFLYNNQHEGTTVEDILAASLKALELDPDLAEAHASHGMALHYQAAIRKRSSNSSGRSRSIPICFEAYYLLRLCGARQRRPGNGMRMDERCVAISARRLQEWLMLRQHYDDLGRTKRPGRQR